MTLILSRAHDVVQELPLSARAYVCRRVRIACGFVELFGPTRCAPHLEISNSGWLDEAMPEERALLDAMTTGRTAA